MTLEQLRIFVAVADRQHVTRAAEMLNIAQSAAPARLRVLLELPSSESVRAAVEAGMGATAISASVAAPSIEAGLLQVVNLALPEREFHVLRHREHYRSQAADALLVVIAAG